MHTDISYKTYISRFHWNVEMSRNSDSIRLRDGWSWVVTALGRGHFVTVSPPLHLLSYRLDPVCTGLCHFSTHPQPNPHTSFHCKASLNKTAKQGEANAKDGELHRGYDSEEDLNEFAWMPKVSGMLSERQSCRGDLSPEPWAPWSGLSALTTHDGASGQVS